MKIIPIIFCCIITTHLLANIPEWQNKKITQVNAEKPHVTLYVFPDKNTALIGNKNLSPYFLSLNGDWKFFHVNKPADKPANFFLPEYSDSNWNTLPVPSNWQLFGYDYPIYTNIKYPFQKDKQKVPEDFNPVGSYRRYFTIPASWDGRRIFITFNGVDAGFYLWINGKKVGYSQDSRTPAEFDITPYLQKGKNLLAVEVYRYTIGSYLEDQDFWRLSGIFRDVYLWSVPKLHIRDFHYTTTFDKNYQNATLNLALEIINKEFKGKADLNIQLLSPSGNIVFDTTQKINIQNKIDPIILKKIINNPKQWTAETPNLYTLLLTLKQNNQIIEVIPSKIGFRQVESRDARLWINGEKVLLKGVNRHDHSATTGHYVSKETMERDIQLMKQANINAVRTSHYPNVPEFYELCDEYGLYVISEGNIETHEFGNNKDNALMNDTSWYKIHFDRVERMVKTHRNHASIIIWSIGNESGDGINAKNIYEWTIKFDPTRLFHNEGSTDKGNFNSTNMYSKMYPSPDQVRQYMTTYNDRPFILCEYTHAMGNSNGGVMEYLNLLYEDNNLIGMFVWDWTDQGLKLPVPEKYKNTAMNPYFFAYGGWWENERNVYNDGNFCMNGLLRSDQKPFPKYRTIQYAYQNISAKLTDTINFEIKFTNHYDFIYLNTILNGIWKIKENGIIINSGTLPVLDIAPGETKIFKPSIPPISYNPNHEYSLELSFIANHDTKWIKAGTELAWKEFPLTKNHSIFTYQPTTNEVNYSETENNYLINGKNFTIRVNKKTGQIDEYRYGNNILITQGPYPNLTRAATDNDRAAFMRNHSVKYTQGVYKWFRPLGENTQRVTIDKINERIKISYQQRFDSIPAIYTINYLIDGNGIIEVTGDYEPGKNEIEYMIRLGMQIQIPTEYSILQWYGKEGETYLDRNFEKTGIFSSTVEDRWTDYSRPQENGNICDLRWMCLTNENGTGLKIIGKNLLSGGAKYYSDSDIQKADYSFELKKGKSIFVNIDYKQTGVGGDNSWSPTAQARPPYRIPHTNYSYTYWILPYNK